MRVTRRRFVAATVVGALAASAGVASADVTTTVLATPLAGVLTVTGTGVSVNVSTTPGSWSNGVNATVLTVTDTRGSAAGWHVTAQYQTPTLATGQADLGSGNLRVTTNQVTGDAASVIKTFGPVVVTSTPATVLNTYGTGLTALSGAGISSATANLDVKIPATAQLGTTYTGNVVYTVVSG